MGQRVSQECWGDSSYWAVQHDHMRFLERVSLACTLVCLKGILHRNSSANKPSSAQCCPLPEWVASASVVCLHVSSSWWSLISVVVVVTAVAAVVHIINLQQQRKAKVKP